jgi:hypothetical protein
MLFTLLSYLRDGKTIGLPSPNSSIHTHSSPNFVRSVNQVLLGSHFLFKELELLTNSVNVLIFTNYTPFRNLNVLKLCGINFTNDFRSNFLLTFPLLTKFESKICAWFVHASVFYVYTPLLQTISIQHDIDMPYYYKNPPRSHINFCCSALHLKEFSYCSFLPQEVSVTSPCHTSAKIIVHESQSYVSYM